MPNFFCQPGAATASVIGGDVRVPGDKSISHRVLLAREHCRRSRRPCAVSSKARIRSRRSKRCAQLGVNISRQHDGRTGNRLLIQGVGAEGLKAPARPLDLGNSGAAMRLLAGLLAGQRFDSTLVGDASLMRRPMERIAAPLREMNADVTTNNGRAARSRFAVAAHFAAIDFEMPIASAQVKSALLIAASERERSHAHHRAGANARSHGTAAPHVRRRAAPPGREPS